MYPADKAGCAYVRCEQPLRVSGVEGEIRHEVDMVGRGIRKRLSNGTVFDERLVEQVPAPIDADVVVFQRPPHEDTPRFIEHFQRQGIAVVVDVDDDLAALHPHNGAYPLYAGDVRPDVHARHVARACAVADLVTVSTPALAERYGAHGRTVVLPNCVPEKILDYPRSSDGHTLGWAGRVDTHPGDLEVTHGGVGEALGDWRFHVIGEAKNVREKLHLPAPPTETPWIASPEDYHRALGSLDVGIAPLGDTAFNAAKSALKCLEMAGRGVPFVASPRAEYQKLGIGLLAKDRSRNWRSALRRLMASESLRTETAEEGKQIVREHHTFEDNGWRWEEAWDQARVYRQGRSARLAA
jgi:glycosyltransferase involved in cell wall biosynthesis